MKKLMKISALALVLVMMVAVFASCTAPAKDPKDAEKALKDAGYEVEVYTEPAMLAYIAEGLEAYLSAVNIEDEEFIYVFYFEDKDAANDAWEEIEKDAEELKKEAEEAEKELVIKKSGKMIWVGTEAAVKAAK